ncbi:MAG: urea carboxylase [Akkermansiaceae bacterium]
MFKKVLIANRGAISCRIQRSLLDLGITPVVVYSDADSESLHVLNASERIHLEGNTPTDTYLDAAAIILAAQESGAEAIHPGYGFLSESASFARSCAEAGIIFLGPTPEQLKTCGLKHICREIARDCGVRLLEGSGLITSPEQALEASQKIGFPVIIKSSAGGGGIGMQVAHTAEEVRSLFTQVQRLSQSNFADQSVFIEKYIEHARHIEVQVFGDGQGNVLTFGERDCSTQRRNQKVVEETPAPELSDEERSEFASAALLIAQSVNYQSAGTIEFLWDDKERSFYFLEVNARLQVEHGVTEKVWGIDLVTMMTQLGADELPALDTFNQIPKGHAIQVRLYAEDPQKDFQPSAGLISYFKAPVHTTRCDTWIQSGTEVSPYYDPMLAKIVSYEPTRDKAIEALQTALLETECYGIESNLDYLKTILACAAFRDGRIHTRFLDSFPYEPNTINVLDAGLETTIQDYPGRIGMWNVGVPPSGPFDSLHFRLGNQILGNEPDAAALEMSVKGGTFQFNAATTICLTGANMEATLNKEAVVINTSIQVKAGDTLKLGFIKGAGQRSYLCITGGIQAPLYLGSRSTFRLGKFGGHAGRALRASDVLHFSSSESTNPVPILKTILPELSNIWDIRVTYGPHGAPDFFTEKDVERIFQADWEVHYNSDRTGIRLIGPKPEWARRDGGEAGLHPSNIHDNAYTVGSVDFTGDMPILLGPDGPSLGGFVCPAVIIKADLWKMGQLKPGDKIRFHGVLNDEAELLYKEQEKNIKSLDKPLSPALSPHRQAQGKQILKQNNDVTYRQSGDGVILVEFGEMELNLDLRFKAQALYQWLKNNPIKGITELVPGIRSLQVQFNPAIIPAALVLKTLEDAELSLPPAHEMEFPSRIVHLPLSWDDPSTQLAIEKYTQLVRKDAPWCPSNIEFIRRINGLESIEDVRKIVYDASYFVMGLGDVYLGAPVATPLDPRHRLVTTKYNPARTWTPENAVGIGGAYLCVYGMEGPGGYQFVGRTLPIWNRFHQTEQFTQPWLLRFFDQIRWFPVSEAELLRMRKDFLTGEYKIKIEETTFKVSDYHEFLTENQASIEEFQTTQRAAFSEERADWERTGAMNFQSEERAASKHEEDILIPQDCEAIYSPIIGSMWKVQVSAEDSVAEGDAILIIESMKTEFTIEAPCAGSIQNVLISEGESVQAGQVLAIIKPYST